ncbi:LuxR C-terminal-related transcriptional regulator [Candidatus Chloroploca sp. Khr17]|uniref:LuxR C-terminal-related transcriptional regulator n=1 Tax=Candidatus Chloroploca sp. Khr17 TaxID=2496869 RepID=UPI00101BD626|nr:LuxR C-terminal-related transcriptional regulator [Candidatus Chloroploca sp. Khr17]
MTVPILATKLYIPPPRLQTIPRLRLLERLNAGLRHDHGAARRLTLISAAAGFGKTTLLSAWVADCQRPVAWLSLDAGDSDPVRFLAYLIAALQTLEPDLGAGVLAALHAPQPPAQEALLTALLNDVAAIPHTFLLVLDDYHALDAPSVDQALAFMLDYMPPQMHLVIATREDPPLPLARLRARDQLTEVRAADLRFTPTEAAAFLNQAMGLNLSAAEIAVLEARTEGWIAGLHLAAVSLQGRADTASFVATFSGSHRFVLDYLVEEVLQQQPANVQHFLLRTAILNRLCGPLCDAVVKDEDLITPHPSPLIPHPSPLIPHPSSLIPHPSSLILHALEHANLFLVPLDNERRWYRYHHLFGDLLRQRLYQQQPDAVLALHLRASIWYEANDLELEAFHHAAAANDVARAARLLEGRGMPLLFRGAAQPVLRWLASLPTPALDAHPALWVTYASALLFVQQVAGVEAKLTAAEAVLPDTPSDPDLRDLIGHIAVIRATLAVTRHDAETIMVQAHRALVYLHPHNLPVRTAVTWALGYARYLQGDRVAAAQAYHEALAASEPLGHFIITLMATMGLGDLQEGANRLHLAAEHYRRALALAGNPPLPVASTAHLGLARIHYAWNDLATAEQHVEQSRHLARQIANTDRLVAAELFLARLKLAQGDLDGAAALLMQIEPQIVQPHVALQRPEHASVHLLLALSQGNLAAAAASAQTHTLPLSRARVALAQGDSAAALTTLTAYRQQAEANGWPDERLKALILQAVAHQALGEKETAIVVLVEALTLAAPDGIIRPFVEAGPLLVQVLAVAAARGIKPAYVRTLLAAVATETPPGETSTPPLIEPLTERELEVLRLIAQGCSNREIGERLYLALDTVKGHNRRIFAKLQVQRRTEAVARARELGLL